MTAASIQINGATIVVDGDGASFVYSWFPPQPIARADVLKIRDWLNLNFPTQPQSETAK